MDKWQTAKTKYYLVFDKEEYKVLYKYKRNIGYVFEWGKIGVIHSADEYGIDVEFNGKRHYSRITSKIIISLCICPMEM